MTIWRNTLGPSYDVSGGISLANEGDVCVNSDGANWVTRGGTWHRVCGTNATAVAKPSYPITFATVAAACRLVDRIPDSAFGPPPEPEPTVMFDDRGARYVVTDRGCETTATNESLAKHVPQHVYTGPVAQPAAESWCESSTCRGVLRSLRETAGKHPPSKPLLDAIEIAAVALVDFDKALGTTEQYGWYQDIALSKAAAGLVFECYAAAVKPGIPFSATKEPCAKAVDAVTAAIAALDKAGGK